MVRSTLHSLLVGLVRRTWFVAVIATVVCTAFAARAVASLVDATYLGPGSGGTPHPPPPPRAPAPPTRPPDGAALVARNMFCSTCAAPPSGPRPAGAAFAGHPAVLIATSVGEDPRATVRVPSTEVQGSWGIGDPIPGVGKVTRIGWVSIDVVDAAGRPVTLSLFDAAEAAGAGAPGAATPARAPAAEPFADRIRKVGEGDYEVDRDLVRDLVSGAAKPGGVRMTPIVKHGEVQGVRVFGARAGSLPAAIGLRNADVLDSIDGNPIKTAQQLLDLYAKLDQLSSVELGGTRAGKPLAITLRLR